MINILKTIALPIVFTLPWIMVNLNESWGKFFEEKIAFQPVVILLILLPSMLIITRWLTRLLGNQRSHH